MGEAADRWEAMRQRMSEQGRSQEERNAAAADMTKALYDLANDLTYPEDQDGNQVNMHWLIPILSYHLARCGYRKDKEAAVIKQIPHPRRGGPGVVEDAVLYVPVDATGTIPEVYINPPAPEEAPAEPVNQPWRTKTHITVDGESVKGGR